MPEKVISLAPAVDQRQAPVPTEQDFQTDTVTIPVKLCNLPPFHSVAGQVLALTADPDVDLKHLASVVEADPAFAAEVLLLANSSLFGFTSRMHVLRHAIAILGIDRIKAVAVTVAMRAFLGKGGPEIEASWRHSIASAVVAEAISPVFDFAGDRAYTAALMHDIGRLGLLKSYKAEVAPVLAAEYQSMDDVLRAERAAVNVDHGLAGAWLVKNWALPESFHEICQRHHEPLRPEDSPLLQLVKVSCRMADTLGFSAVRCRTGAGYRDLIHDLPAHLPRRMFPAQETLLTALAERMAAFEA